MDPNKGTRGHKPCVEPMLVLPVCVCTHTRVCVLLFYLVISQLSSLTFALFHSNHRGQSHLILFIFLNN